MDPQWIWTDHKEMFLVIPAFFVILISIFLIESKFRFYMPVVLNLNIVLLIIILFTVICFDFLKNLYHSFYPFSKLLSPVSDERTRIRTYFRSKSELIKAPLKKAKKNIIFFQIESFEKQTMGKFNKYYSKLMPFVSNYSERGTFISNMITQPYTTWTTGSIFATHCGMPHVVTDMTWRVLQRTSQTSDWPNVTCFPDYLRIAGYNIFAIEPGDMSMMRMKDFFKKHQFEIYDNSVHHKGHDWDTISYIGSDMFPILEKSQPFYLFATNKDTHPFFHVDRRCKNRIYASKMLRSFDCFDQIFERFVKTYENSSFFKNTLFIVIGDHLMIGDFSGVYDPPRKLAMFMPYEEKRTIEKQTTLYDVAPTILDLLGIKYWPAFPFGTNLYNNKIGKFPSTEDFSTIYDILHKTISAKSTRIKCFGNEGFCDDANSYINNRKGILRMK